MNGVREALTRLSGQSAGVGLFVDGPNVLREEFTADLNEIRTAARDQGQLAISRLYLNERASTSLIQAGEARGFEVRVTSGDVDVRMAVDAAEAVVGYELETLVIASRDADFKPVVELARKHGIETVGLIPGEHGRSDALVNAVAKTVSLEDRTSPEQQ